jgi:hypothetical protein
MNILILPSEDGQEYVAAVIYPDGWAVEQADWLAKDAFTAVQKKHPTEWSWEDCVPELTANGFICVKWHRGPTWDRQRVPIPEVE